MLTLHYNGYDIPTGKEFSIRFSWKNPACFTEEIPGPAGLGIDIPVNDYSRAIFGNPERFEKYGTGSDRKYPGFEVRFGGVLLMSGIMVINSADQEKYSGWLQSEMGALGEEQRDKNISEMEWDPDGERTFQNKTDYDDATDDYHPYPVLNGAFWNGKGRETDVQFEYTDEDGEVHKAKEKITFLTRKFRENFSRIINTYNDAGYKDILGRKGDGEACVISPYLYLRPFLRMLFKINRLFIDRNDMVSAGLDMNMEKYLLLYNNFNIMGQIFTTETQILTNYDDVTGTVLENQEQVIVSMSWGLEPFQYKDLVPHVALKDLLLGLQNYLNYIFIFKPRNKIDVIDRNSIPEDDAFDLDKYFLGHWIIGEKKDSTLKFVNDFDGEDRMFGQEFHDLTDRRADFADPVDTFDDLKDLASPVEGELRLVKDENKIYEYKWKVFTSADILAYEDQYDALGWEFVSSGPQPFLFGESDKMEEIKSCFSTLQFWSGSFGLPVALQQGNLKRMKSSFVGFTPRLINSNNILYPEALNWDGPGGLFKQRWEKWSRFWKNRLAVEGSFDLPLNVLYHVVNNITGKYRTVHGDFVIETIETEFGSNMIGTTRITGFKI
jgi:hypothetical protein